MSILVPVPASRVTTIWPIILPKVRAAIRRCDNILIETDVLSALLTSEMQLWTNDDVSMIAITQITTYPGKGKYLTWIVVSGVNFDANQKHQEFIVNWSKENGCIGQELFGRPGWSRRLPDFKEVYRLLRQDYGR